MIDVKDPTERRFRLLPKQRKFIDTTDILFLGYGGGIGAGKTWAAIIKVILRCQQCPNALVLIARKDLPKLIDSVLTKMWKLFPDLEQCYNKEEQILTLPNGAKIYIRHGTDEQDFKGPDFSMIYLDQLEELSENIFWHMVGRLRHRDGMTPQLIFTFNPNGHDWLYRIFKKNQMLIDKGDSVADKRLFIIETKTKDNIYLPPEQMEALDLMKRHQPNLYKRLAEGSWDAAAGLVYEEFSDAHIYKPDKLIIPWKACLIRSTDFGQTNQNFSTWWYVDEEYNHYAFREHIICGPDATLKKIAEAIIEASQTYNPFSRRMEEEEYEYSFLDPWSGFKQSSEKDGVRCSIADIWAQDYGLHYIPATRNKRAAIAHVRSLMAFDPKHRNPFTGEMGAPHLYISEACPELIEQIRNLKWKQLPSRLEGYSNQPEEVHKVDDHGPDAMWMALASRPMVTIEKGFKLVPTSYAAAVLKKEKNVDIGQTLEEEEFLEIFYGTSQPGYAWTGALN